MVSPAIALLVGKDEGIHPAASKSLTCVQESRSPPLLSGEQGKGPTSFAAQ